MKPQPVFQLRGHFFLLSMLFILLITCLNTAFADPDFLEPEKAFQFSSSQSGSDKIEVTYRIADGYYMYRERFQFRATGMKLGEPIVPRGEIKFDENFQKDVETLRHEITIEIPVKSIDNPNLPLTLVSTSQGCSDQGLCYVPMESKQTFVASSFNISANPTLATGDGGGESAKLAHSLQSGRLAVIIPMFLLIGLGLSFTPCVLPMVPILSSIIVGEGGHVSKRRGTVLSISYSLGMAIVYTALGVAAGLLGEGLAATLQKPWVLGAFGMLLVVLSLSMFNVYHLQVPAVLQSRLAHFSERQRAGKLIGVFMMGAISALIVGPCVAAPLASALLYIGQTHNVVVGGTALFSMAIGMSVPLILVGISAGSVLPRVGRWMESVKQLFGVLMLAMALWIVSPVVPVWFEMLGCSLLLAGYGYFLIRQEVMLIKAIGLTLCVLGVIELVAVASGGRDVLNPFSHYSNKSEVVPSTKFVRIKSNGDLELALEQAKSQGKFVMLDFYADWCIACKEMEKFTFEDKRVQEKMAKMTLLQADVTANNDDDKALLKRFKLFGPPGIIFFSPNGEESGRVIGFEKADQFLNSLSAAETMPVK